MNHEGGAGDQGEAALDAQTFEVSGPAVIARDFGSELVIAHLDTGVFYSCGGSAAPIWALLLDGWSPGAITSVFPGASPMLVKAALHSFIATLSAENLIRPCTSLEPQVGDVPVRAEPFEVPSLERFDDLQGLLMVDPIHDVTEQGWPLQPA